MPTPESGAFFFPIDGAVSRVDPSATAFPYRDVRFSLGIFGSWHDAARDAAVIDWVREYHAEVLPTTIGDGYANWISEAEAGRD